MDYSKEKNEVTIYGCYNCPFSSSSKAYHCLLLDEKKWKSRRENGQIRIEEMKEFPEDCPLRDPNFRLMRIIEK